MAVGFKTGGRKKGSQNKITGIAKDAIAQAAQSLGGVDRLVQWAKSDPLNERVFWGTIYPKLLPLQVTGEGGGPIQNDHDVRVSFVRPSSQAAPQS